MPRRIVTAFLVIFLSSMSFAQASYRLRTRTASEYAALQRQVVGAYCRFDFEGSRLSDEGWQKVKPLVQQRTNHDFNVVEIVSRYQIAPGEGPSSNFVTVTYSVLGRYEVGYGYRPSPQTHDVMFRAEEKDGEMVITDVDPNIPRVSKRAVVQWLKSEAQKATNGIAKAQIEKSLAELEAPATGSVEPAK